MKYFMMMMATLLVLNSFGCVQPTEETGLQGLKLTQKPYDNDTHTNKDIYNGKPKGDYGGIGAKFKIPLPPGENWEVTQSWAEHCQICNAKGYNTAYDNFFGDFCTEMSHAASCLSACMYGWDFNLPGTEDLGKPALASGEGEVKSTGNNGWGNYVIIDHGNNICTRYAHLDSIAVSKGQQVCQGLKVGEIGATGGAVGAHLHFQFEECDTQTPLAMGFDDGNKIPECTMGDDVLDANGKYNFLKLTNEQVDNCGEGPSEFNDDAKPKDTGWTSSSCGTLSGCPLIPNCGNQYGHQFKDQSQLDGAVAQAAAYLHSECVLNGKADGKLHPQDDITRAEALKVSLHLFGLKSNCGGSVPFQDVHKNDWFYDTVACGVKHGIISTDNKKSFFPNMPVSMGEAAKMLVESASKANMVDMKKGSGYFSKISASHWAYKYLRTLNQYGGLSSGMLSKSAEDQLTRGQFIVMTASLSPCYCKNISCTGNCVCDQSVYACVDPNDKSPGTGGPSTTTNNNTDKEDEKEDDDPKPAQTTSNNSVKASINCFVDQDWSKCKNAQTVFVVRCEISNKSDVVLKVDTLLMYLPSSGSGCQVTHSLVGKGVGFTQVYAGMTKKMSGGFEISCGKMPTGAVLQVYLDMGEKIGPGNTKTHVKMFSPKITIPQETFNKCAPAPTNDNKPSDGPKAEVPLASTSWKCDPAKGYTVYVWSPGGIYEAVGSGPVPYITNKMEPSLAYPILYDCIDLPGAVRIHGGPQGMKIWQPDTGMPGFNVWFPFNLPTTINPPYKPDLSTGSFKSSQPYTSALFRFPPQ